MQVSQQVYEDAQYQSSDPIGYQPPIPAGIHDIELSWDRKRGYMRVIIDGATWHFKEFLGRAQILGTDSKRGRINLRAMARIDGETLTTYRDPSAQPHPEALRFTKNYIGDLNAEWHMADSIAHIYHNGTAIIDSENVAHLYE